MNKELIDKSKLSTTGDGKDESKARAHKRGLLNELHNRLQDLAKSGIVGALVSNDNNPDNARAIIGTHKGDPFIIYYLTIVAPNDEYGSILCTRYRGVDHRKKRPVEVLNG